MDKAEILRELGRIFDLGYIGLGSKTKEFEEKFAKYIGVKYAVALNSATAALHLACLALGIKKGDEVIVPAMTFVSTGLAPLYCGAKPVFADIEEDTLCIDPKDIEKKITNLPAGRQEKLKAIIVVHYGGHACKMDEILRLAKKYKLYIIEDAAHACGAKYLPAGRQGKNKMLGSIGKMGCFSFHAVKNLPTGDGGMITTDDKKIYTELLKLRWVGINKDTWARSVNKKYLWKYSVDELGFKCHMNDITAVIGLAQLKVLKQHNLVRRHYAKKYDRAFKDLKWIKTPVEKDYAYSCFHNYVIKTVKRDELNRYLASKGISTGVHYEPICRYKVFGKPKTNLPITEKAWKNILTLPLYPDLSEKDFKRVVGEIKNFGKIKKL